MLQQKSSDEPMFFFFVQFCWAYDDWRCGLLQLHSSGMLFCILLLCLPTSFSSLVILWPLVSTSPHHSLESLQMVVLENPSWSTVSERLSLACPLNPFSSPLWCWLWTSSGHQWPTGLKLLLWLANEIFELTSSWTGVPKKLTISH